MNERWMPVVGYEGRYEVSDQGRVRGLPRTRNCRGHTYRVQGKILARIVDPSTGYVVTNLGDGVRIKKFSVHVLLLEAFIGPRPSPQHEGCHGDGVRHNCVLTNLRWDTSSGNHADMIGHGTATRGEKNGGSVLSAEMVEWIRESQQSSLALAPVLGVASSTIRAVRIGQNWAHQ